MLSPSYYVVLVYGWWCRDEEEEYSYIPLIDWLLTWVTFGL